MNLQKLVILRQRWFGDLLFGFLIREMEKLVKELDLPDRLFQKGFDEIWKAPSGKKCGICNVNITNEEEIMYPDSPECCNEHGFISLCPRHQSWFWNNQNYIQDKCIKECFENYKQ